MEKNQVLEILDRAKKHSERKESIKKIIAYISFLFSFPVISGILIWFSNTFWYLTVGAILFFSFVFRWLNISFLLENGTSKYLYFMRYLVCFICSQFLFVVVEADLSLISTRAYVVLVQLSIFLSFTLFYICLKYYKDRFKK